MTERVENTHRGTIWKLYRPNEVPVSANRKDRNLGLFWLKLGVSHPISNRYFWDF